MTTSLPTRADEPTSDLEAYRGRVDESIDRALQFLASRQQEDGSYEGGMRRNPGIVSLATMAYLAKGYTPLGGPYSEEIRRGIDYVLSHQRGNGLIVHSDPSHGPMYGHCISTLMLSEVSGMVDPARQKRLDEVLPKALKIILSAQQIEKDKKHRGGWRYQHNSRDSDISCTGWALMALRSARGNGAQVPSESIEQAIDYLMRCRHKSGGFCYMPGQGPGLARTGTGLLCLELLGRHGEPSTIQAGDWILEHLPRQFGKRGKFFYYALYYCSQGMFQVGGKHWQRWARNMYEMMLKHQEDDGSWPRGDGNEGKAGEVYSTAMSVLAMSVAYRQLPIYQR